MCHQHNFIRIFPLLHGIPSHDTFQHVFDEVNPEAFFDCFVVFTKYLASAVKSSTALDSKTIRNSNKNSANLHVVSA